MGCHHHRRAPSQRVLGIRRRGHYRLIDGLLPQIFQYAMENGIPVAGMPAFLCHECSPEAAQEADRSGTADVEVIVPIAGDARPSGEIRVYTVPGGRMARAVHRGPCEGCESTFLRLFSWLAERGPIREVYLNDPREVPSEEIATGICVPIG
ncbi:MAG: GyrI-like domain-containing protein [Methanomicrobiales archaeon]|nr:GyrI-like domain-containing protein [Methanomicrobiales archaeon]MDI6877017.1 GyrI-like domain-containing protein [Methanomicrobiales archaeon]